MSSWEIITIEPISENMDTHKKPLLVSHAYHRWIPLWGQVSHTPSLGLHKESGSPVLPQHPLAACEGLTPSIFKGHPDQVIHISLLPIANNMIPHSTSWFCRAKIRGASCSDGLLAGRGSTWFRASQGKRWGTYMCKHVTSGLTKIQSWSLTPIMIPM